MQIFLHDDIAAAGEARILGADQHRGERLVSGRVLGAVDKSEEIALVEIAEALHLVDRRYGGPEPGHDLRRQFKAQVEPLRTNVEQQVARGRDGVAGAGADLAERVQLQRLWRAEQPVPEVGADPHRAGEPATEVAKADGAHEIGEFGAERPHRLKMRGALGYGEDEKHRGARQRFGYRLRGGAGRRRQCGLHRMISRPARRRDCGAAGGRCGRRGRRARPVRRVAASSARHRQIDGSRSDFKDAVSAAGEAIWRISSAAERFRRLCGRR